MDFEREYYEIESFWNTPTTAEDYERIKTISNLFPHNVESIVDVGCGNGVFVNFLVNGSRKYKRVCGVDRSITALGFVKSEKIQASIDKLPFHDNEFDLVLCLEVIEHLPQNIYRQGLKELTRVSNKYIIVSVPNEQNIEIGRITCLDCRTLFNPDLHLRSFTRDSVSNLLNDYGFTCKEIIFVGEKVCYPILDDINYIRNKYKTLVNPWDFNILCPVCGSLLPGKKSSTQKGSIISTVKGFIQGVWPKITKGRWITAVYEKQSF